MGSEIYPGISGPPPALDGMNCCMPGTGLNDFILVRDDDDGTIANAETLSSKAGTTGKLLGGIIDISRVTQINIGALITFAGLTTVDIIPAFKNEGTPLFYLATGAIAVGIITVSKKIFRIPAALTAVPIMIPIQNPGAKYMVLYTASATTITSSSMKLYVGAGWANKEIAGV